MLTVLANHDLALLKDQSLSLLSNAIGAIQIAIEDFESNDDRRVHSAIRNLHAGVLLLCKVKLQRLSPDDSDEVLLKQSVEPQTLADGGVRWVGTGKKTVDQQAIKTRFKSLGVKVDWRRLESINDIRNNTEHYYFSGTRSQALEAFAEACVLIRELLVDVLQEDPVALIGEPAWTRLYENQQVFEKELAACRISLNAINWSSGAQGLADHVSCPDCGSKLVRQQDDQNTDQVEAVFLCTACGEETSDRDMILHALDEAYGADAYISVKDGGDPPVIDCPECGEEGYVAKIGACALCDFAMPEDAECAVCGNALSPEEYGEYGSLCSYHAHVAGRND